MQLSKPIGNRRSERHPTRIGSVSGIVVTSMLAILLVASCLVLNFGGDDSPGHAQPNIHQVATSQARSSSEGKSLFPVEIRKPTGPPRCDTGVVDNAGLPVTVSCSTCHANRKPNLENRAVSDLDEFHGSLKLAHGSISCLSCHNPDNYDSLKLADGSRVEFTDVMTLCAQCHGPQMKDYEHGAHGGMNGYWDRTRGPQTKNNCVDCHNPHAPQFPKMQPDFKPRDRFLEKESH